MEHECLVCRRPVMHENKNLIDHMHKTHKFNLATYEERHYFPSVRGQAPAAKSNTEPIESTNVMMDKGTKTLERASIKSTTTKPTSLLEKPESQPTTASASQKTGKSARPKKIILGKTTSEKPPELHRPKLTTKRKLEFSSENKENVNGGGAELKKVGPAAEASKPKPASRDQLYKDWSSWKIDSRRLFSRE